MWPVRSGWAHGSGTVTAHPHTAERGPAIYMANSNESGNLHRLRHDASLTGLPIIVLTAEDGQTVERRVLTMGADDYTIKPKPFEGPVLLARVNAVFSRVKMRVA